MHKPYTLPLSLHVGFGDIDAEHQGIVDKLNVLLDCVRQQGTSPDRPLERHFGELRSLLRVHFDHEEAKMAELGYRHLDAHRITHDRSLVRFDTVVQSLSNGAAKLDVEPLDEIFSVIVDDLMHADIGFKAFLYEKGILR